MKHRGFSFSVFLLAGVFTSTLSAAPVSLFDGRSFNGWEGPLEFFRIEDGCIVGGSLDKKIPKNQFLATKKAFSDFDLRLKFKVVGKGVNAGIQVRSRRVPNHHEMVGYQADIGQRYWGSIYDESRRRRVLAQADFDALMKVVRLEGWNDYRILCEGKRVRLWINGHQTVDYTEPDDSVEQHGIIGLQIHSGPPTEAWYKDITIQELPAAPTLPLKSGVRGVATRAPGPVKIDGDLAEFGEAFGTPLEYFQDGLLDRAAQVFYLWDDDAFYVGLRTLDRKPLNSAPGDHSLWNGDAVEWYFDTRSGEAFRSRSWGPGAGHCYWSGLTGTEARARFSLTADPPRAFPTAGVEVGSRLTEVGLEVEFKLPWKSFPKFRPQRDEIIGVDFEICYGDGGGRVARSFVYGGPLSVQQPANLAKVQLVGEFRREYWRACGPVLAPIRSDIEWAQTTKPNVTAFLALPPNEVASIGRVLFRLVDLRGSTIAEYEGAIETFAEYGSFKRAVARWPSDFAPAGTYNLVGIVYDKDERELTRVAPRMVSVGERKGY